MTLLIVNVCAFANRTTKLPQHVGAMSWHQSKFHDFHARFGFIGIKKPSFSMFPAEPWRPDVWISFPFLAWDLEIYPRTHMWFFNQLWCTRACACISNLNYAHKGVTFPLRTTSLLERSSGLQEAYTKTCSNSAKNFTTALWCHDMTPWQVSLFSGKFWIYKNLKNKFLNVSGRHDAQMFKFHSHFLHGT